MSGSENGRVRWGCGVALLAASLAAQGCRAADPARNMPPEQKARFEAMREQGAAASMTIFPVAITVTNEDKKGGGDMGREVAKVVGFMLEQAGMANLEPTDLVFEPPSDAAFEELPAQFGAFVREHQIKTDYAFFAEIVGQTGNPPRFDEIRQVVVDKQGACLWSDRQTPDDAEFKRLKPECLMTASVLLADRVKAYLAIPAWARDESGKGTFAKLAAAESPAPDKSEWDAMQKRQATMKKAGKTATVAVYPVRLSNDEVGADDAAQLAKLLTEKKLCRATAVDSDLRVEIQRSHNEQKLLWDLARAFKAYVKEHPPTTDYALLADYLIGRSGRVGGVHFVVCDRAGDWVIVDYQNSHHGDFNSVDPKSRADCGKLVVRRLGTYLR